ncbi:hypothetical protein M2139_000346 [Enterococcus sp. PF1-24]|nr:MULTISPECIES: hypothetical protein [unclassified Enterococcus]MDH6363234.1 hypothetical protein [Enterococcus sp. PFB1-1]MDH6400465.1 hypothetical protein [Enterococcus sp. PF1-24]
MVSIAKITDNTNEVAIFSSFLHAIIFRFAVQGESVSKNSIRR